MYIVLGLLSAVTAGLVAIFAKVGLKNVDSTVATTVRALIMFVVLFLVVAALRKTTQLFSIHQSSMIWIVASGVAGALSWIFYFWALSIAPANKVAALDRTSIIFVVIFSSIFLGDRLTVYSISGSVLIALGAYLMVLVK